MFITKEERLILAKHKRAQLIKMYREVLTRIVQLNHEKLHVNVTAMFRNGEFSFDITVFDLTGDNTTLAIYDFYEIKKAQKYVNACISAVKIGNFEKVKAVTAGIYR